MRLCLVQHDDRGDAELKDERALIDLNQAVCERDAACRYLFTRQHFDKRVEPHWQKLLAVRAALKQGCQHAVWLDSDVGLHTSHAIKLLDSFQGRSVFANADPPPDLTPRFFEKVANPQTASMNAGIWGVANTDKGRSLLDAWIALYPSHLWSVERRRGVAKTNVGDPCLITRPEPAATSRFMHLRALAASEATRGPAAAAQPAAERSYDFATAGAAQAALEERAEAARDEAAVAADAPAKSTAERALERTEQRVRNSAAGMKPTTLAAATPEEDSSPLGCGEGKATYVRAASPRVSLLI